VVFLGNSLYLHPQNTGSLYSKTEASEIRQAFWTSFGQFMALQPESKSTKINWVNYKTGVKHLQFKMDADSNSASICIEMNHSDPAIQLLMYEKFQELQRLLDSSLQEGWDWNLHADDQGRTITRISKTIDRVSVYRKEDWHILIPFFKQRIIALHNFWEDAQFMFEMFS
jgi:hypothetical protein